MQRLSSLHSPAQLCLDAMKGLQSVLDNSNISHVPKSRLVWKKEPEEDFEGALLPFAWHVESESCKTDFQIA